MNFHVIAYGVISLSDINIKFVSVGAVDGRT